ncbi:release factor glutamine methyltransferase [Dethiosulfatibacter aminovorans DSM 17477]|uniref:Release factor glutamine methyltransferase n=1 Tax=Dethiosulfatibacter aminovorans DSM 17477 TaxID=1121476 RepID=A0A1M6HJF2_9FIRM|nr:peptide chain release factor N(5)-glutamine methyltransferase [Dethiosulfatibacter aminovorans]SHJ22308.1 release factor glutamine methyltransferase [Dethiosulfatibacter aminovorans DSM 17477]
MVEKSIRQCIKEAVEVLGQREYMNPLLDAQLLLAYAMGREKLYVIMNMNETLDEKTEELFFSLVGKRKKGCPLQYITNSQEFMGLDFHVEEGVLIPRPDTENIVEYIIDMAKKEYSAKDNIRILDIGSGSGAIGCSLAEYLENSSVAAIDISDIAVKVSDINRERLGLENFNVMKMDIFDDIWKELGSFDIVVSNPPYIPEEDVKSLQVEVAEYEPKLALIGGNSGYDYYERIISITDRLVKPGGVLVMEHGHDQSEKIVKMLEEKAGVERVDVIEDLSGIKRGAAGYFKN